jgi:deoxyribodipyrimidine photo-lyase
MDTTYAAGLMWFRRDLRAADNAALAQALRAARAVHCAFVFDRTILDSLPRSDRRVEFIRDAVAALDGDLRALGGGGVIALDGDAAEEIPRLAARLGVQAVFANEDDEPAALARDRRVRERLAAAGIALHTFKDSVVFAREEVRTQAGTPYSVFTPYSRAWLAKLRDEDLLPHEVRPLAARLASLPAAFGGGVPALEDLGCASGRARPAPCSSCGPSRSGSPATTGCATCRR